MEEKKSEIDLITPRKIKLEMIIEKRISNTLYLKKIHEGNMFWMNICRITREDLYIYSSSNIPKQRVIQYYYLALSIESMIHSRSSPLISLLKGFNQLIEEYEFYSSGSTMQGMRLMIAKPSPSPFPQVIQPEIDEDRDQFKTQIYKFQNSAVFEYLKTPNLGKVYS